MTFLKTVIATLVIATSSAGYAQAQDHDSGAYGGIGVSAYVTNPDGAFGTELYTVDAKLGYNFNKYFGVEAQGSLGLNTDSEDVPFGLPEPASLNTKVDYSVGAFAVARLPVSDKFEIFARGGVHNTQVNVEFNNGEEVFNGPRTETGVAVGAGAQFNFDNKNGIRADYTYLDGTNGETLSLGYIRKF